MRRHTLLRLLALGALAAALPLACGPSREVTRVDPEIVVDFDYRFDEDDARAVADAMIDQALDHPWLDQWFVDHARRPVVIVGFVRNDTSDYIDTALFTKQIERALIDSGRIRLVAESTVRDELRDERLQGQEYSRPETVKRLAYELGADLMLLGRVGESLDLTLDQQSGSVYYQVNLELIDIESNEKLWIGERQIEKLVETRG
jgi:uncharacterized protein (TIGR02722 family)